MFEIDYKSPNYKPYREKGNFVELAVGAGSNVFKSNPSGVFAGATNYSDALFKLSYAGAITATSGSIGGWTLGSSALTAGSSTTTVGLDSGGTNPALYAGSSTPGSAPFRVTKTGVLNATGATVSGAITATSGSITGDLTVSGSLLSGSNPGQQVKLSGSEVLFYDDGVEIGSLYADATGKMIISSKGGNGCYFDGDSNFFVPSASMYVYNDIVSGNGSIYALNDVYSTNGSVYAKNDVYSTNGSVRALNDIYSSNGSVYAYNDVYSTNGKLRANDNVKTVTGVYEVGDYSGVSGTFEDNDGNTVRVRGGIITDLTE